MKLLLKLLTNGRVMSAVISALGAIISAMCVGCKLMCKNLVVEFSDFTSATNTVMEVIR